MNNRFGQLLDGVLVRSPAQPLFQWRAARRLTVLAYHGIDDPACFEQQLEYLANHMHPVSLAELLAAIDGRRGLPRRAVLITFDDGDRSVLEKGVPLLQARGLPAVAFVIAGLLDTNTPFWWDEAETLVSSGGIANGLGRLSPAETVHALKKVDNDYRLAVLSELRATAPVAASPKPQLRRHELSQLEAAGIAVGNHTLTHPCLPRCPEATIQRELQRAHETLTNILGRAPRAFAYPNGGADRRVINTLRELGYQAAFLFDHQLCSLPIQHPYAISRVRVNSDTPLNRFRIIVSGLHPAIHHFRGKS